MFQLKPGDPKSPPLFNLEFVGIKLVISDKPETRLLLQRGGRWLGRLLLIGLTMVAVRPLLPGAVPAPPDTVPSSEAQP